MFTQAAVLRRTSFDCSPQSCLRVRDDPTPPTPPSSNSIWRACVREAECTCFHVPVSPIVHTIVCRSLARCARGDSEHRTTFGQSPQNTHRSAASGDFHVQRNSHFISSTSALSRTRRSREQACINDYGTERPRCAPSIAPSISADTGSLVPVLGLFFFFFCL